MKTRTVETVTSNDEWVRMRIYDGDLPLDQALNELLQLERAQHAQARRDLLEARSRLDRMAAVLEGRQP